MKKWDVFVFGDCNADLIIQGVRELPEPGSEKEIEEIQTFPGGGAALFAMGIGKLGLKPVLQSAVGNDGYGSFVLERLEAAHVDCSLMERREQEHTGISLSFTNHRDRAFLTAQGTNRFLPIGQLDLEAIRDASWVHLTGYEGSKNHGEYGAALKRIPRGEGITVSFDVGWDGSGEWGRQIYELFPYLDVVFMNETEALHYTRKDSAKEAAMDMARSVGMAVVKLGSQGAVAACRGELFMAPAYRVEAVDSTGAGDSFNAGFIYGCLKGRPLEECLTWGNACGAMSVCMAGGNTGFPTEEELRRWVLEKQDARNNLAVSRLVWRVRSRLKAVPRLGEMFEACCGGTLYRAVKKQKDGTVFIITGDIPAMWLRDSVCQMKPYLPLAGKDREIAGLLKGLVRRLFQCICLDPYANAFNETDNGKGHQTDRTSMKPCLWERKFEVDSLCYPVQLSYLLWKATGKTDHFDHVWLAGAEEILKVFQTEQNHESRSDYRFVREGWGFTETLSREGKGALVKDGVGLIWSGFRPSDDACVYGYHIPSNMFAAVILRYMEEIGKYVAEAASLGERAGILAGEVEAAIAEYGVVDHWRYGKVYAYEVDGFGQCLIMDDANVPSLLSIPYLGYEAADAPLYQSTRAMVLSENNPYYYRGSALGGIGSLHTPPGYVWHIAVAMEGLTGGSPELLLEKLQLMADTDGGTGFLHEGVDKDCPEHYTREWFSWANAVFCEGIMKYCGEL